MNAELLNKHVASVFGAIVLGCLLLAGTACKPQKIEPDLTPPGGQGKYGVTFSVAQRYGIDRNSNGVVDMPNSAQYVQGPLSVKLDANRMGRSYPSKWPYATRGDAGFNNREGPWRWTFTPSSSGAVPQGLANLPTPMSNVPGFAGTNDGQSIVTYSNWPDLTIELFEGDWSIELARMDTSGNPIYWKSETISINDLLIVQLGDSYSSGEGAPDRIAAQGFWGDDGTGANGAHASAHRSSNTWGSIFAQNAQSLATLLAALGGSGSVTYINLAESGALIDDVNAQLNQLSALVGPRKIDMVLISIGGNDAGFASAIAAYLLREPIAGGLLGPDLSDIENAIRTGDWVGGPFTDVGSVLIEMFDWAVPQKFRNVRGLNGLGAGYQQLASQLQARGIDPGRVYILQYPDALVANRSNPDEVCPGPILTAASQVLGRQLEMGRGEQRHARSNFIVPLNQQIAASAAQWGWKVISAETALYGHAICEDDRWVVRYKESKNLQGDHKGTLHPNKKGHEAIAKIVESVWLQ